MVRVDTIAEEKRHYVQNLEKGLHLEDEKVKSHVERRQIRPKSTERYSKWHTVNE